MSGQSSAITPTRAKRRKSASIAREDGEQRLIDAAIELAREQPFGDLSARAIARRADLNHGYVHLWFGSKAALLLAASQHQTERLVTMFTDSLLTPSVVLHPEVEIVFRLLARLQTEPGGIDLARGRERPMADLIASRAQRMVGLSAEDAAMVAALSVATAAGVATVGKVLDFDVEKLITAWVRMIASFRGEVDAERG
ncbi:MAG: helix-turn-helix transcriptional regulator [Actinobacteria bacterium]|nr:helix-turn-helix transcriptional regulator [Actinomycetota bacterium]